MTTTVKILIEGNKACSVGVKDGPEAPDYNVTTVKPGEFTTKNIHGDQRITVIETGDFVS